MQEAGTYIKKTYHRLRNSGTWSSIFDAVLFVGSIVFAVNVLMNLLGFFIASGFMEQKITLLVWEMSREQSSLFWFFILYILRIINKFKIIIWRKNMSFCFYL